VSDMSKDFRISALIYESACHQLQVNILSRKILELEAEILKLQKEIEKLIID
jgi:hypothetical protein